MISPEPSRNQHLRGPRPARARAGHRQAGFTLLELIVVIAIIGILATIAMPALRPVPQRAQEAVLKTNLTTIRETLDQYHGDKGHYPSSLESLVDEGYLRSIPIDPLTKSADTWVVEYEEIDPDATPAETDLPEDQAPGIFDVRSGSPRTSLDGTLYSEW